MTMRSPGENGNIIPWSEIRARSKGPHGSSRERVYPESDLAAQEDPEGDFSETELQAVRAVIHRLTEEICSENPTDRSQLSNWNRGRRPIRRDFSHRYRAPWSTWQV